MNKHIIHWVMKRMAKDLMNSLGKIGIGVLAVISMAAIVVGVFSIVGLVFIGVAHLFDFYDFISEGESFVSLMVRSGMLSSTALFFVGLFGYAVYKTTRHAWDYICRVVTKTKFEENMNNVERREQYED